MSDMPAPGEAPGPIGPGIDPVPSEAPYPEITPDISPSEAPMTPSYPDDGRPYDEGIAATAPKTF